MLRSDSKFTHLRTFSLRQAGFGQGIALRPLSTNFSVKPSAWGHGYSAILALPVPCSVHEVRSTLQLPPSSLYPLPHPAILLPIPWCAWSSPGRRHSPYSGCEAQRIPLHFAYLLPVRARSPIPSLTQSRVSAFVISRAWDTYVHWPPICIAFHLAGLYHIPIPPWADTPIQVSCHLTCPFTPLQSP
jgi:hypothetical protein